MDLLKKRFARFAGETPPPQAPSLPDGESSDKFDRIARARAQIAALAALEPRPISRPVERIERVVSIEEEDAEQRLFDDDHDYGHARRIEPGGPDTLPGLCIDTPHGPLHRVETFLEPRHAHGATAITPALRVDPAIVAKLALDPTLAAIDPRRMLLLDTETTGLMGGTGTVPFLIGIAWFEDESLRVEQLVLRRLGEEGPMLRHFCERLAAASCIVTFNGKSFDWPLLRTRCVLSRVKMPEPPPHLDLLHCARRVYRARITESLRLVALERTVLGMFREDDVDGSEVPALYLRFLRGAHGRILLKVIEHNRLDLVAMAALLGRIERGFREIEQDADPRDHLAYARVAHRSLDVERAREFARAALEGGADDVTLAEAALLLAKIARRAGDRENEAQPLLVALERIADQEIAARVHLALAMYFEHRGRDLSRALEHAHHTCEPAERKERRIARLNRRRLRAAS